MQNLIGIRIADAGEQVRIGKGSFERVILATQYVAKGVEIGFENFQSPWIVVGQRLFAAHDVQRGSLLGAGLGES